MTVKAVALIVLGVLVYLNDKYAWMNWAQFVALIAVLAGLKKLLLKKMC